MKQRIFALLAALLCAGLLGSCTLQPEIAPPEIAATVVFDFSTVPEYSGEAYAAVNGNTPFFTAEEITAASFEEYSPLDELDRCGVAWASVGQDLMPTEKRGSIGSVKPTGWHTVRYDGLVDGNYLYNRCHLLGFQLTGENANECNLITGTRYMNVDGMLPFENLVADYVKETDNHVMYRVTPVFLGEDLVARGVLMEALSVEDDGDGVCFCVFVYNIQPGVDIDYATGESALTGSAAEQTPGDTQYIGNKNSQVFHLPDCSGLPAEQNRVYFDSRDAAVDAGYRACGKCSP